MKRPKEVGIALSLGSNLGDRRTHLAEAVAGIAERTRIMRVSSLYETTPVGDPDQPHFLNAAVTARTGMEPLDVLRLIQELEERAGRVRIRPDGPRTLDIDLVLYGDVRVDSPSLAVPHPRWRSRGFVWVPLNEIASDWVDPEVGLTVAEVGRRESIDLTGVSRVEEPGWAEEVPC